MRNPVFENGQIYHVYNRGVEKRTTYQDDGDRLRFIHHLYECNDAAQTRNLTYHLSKDGALGQHSRRKRDLLVQILAFTLMPNHFHLLLKQLQDGGVSKFMQKIGTGYTMFFNTENARSGALFQGKFKAVHVSDTPQLLYVLQYIHLNPVPLFAEATSFGSKYDLLRAYRWSSLPDYLGIHNFSSITHRDEMLALFGGAKKYERDLQDVMQSKTTRCDTMGPSLLLDLHSSM